MIRNSAKVTDEAMSLPPRSRAKLAEQLLDSLDGPKHKEWAEAWAKDAEDRVDAYDRGEIKAIPGKIVFRRLKSGKKR